MPTHAAEQFLVLEVAASQQTETADTALQVYATAFSDVDGVEQAAQSPTPVEC